MLGRFFKQDKFSSFQRQLNLYGFRKITKGSESGSYQHPHFRRGERTTLLTIRRSTKASPARVVVPVSPASAGAGTPPPAVSLNNDSVRNKNTGFGSDGGGGGNNGFSSSSSSANANHMSAKGNSGTNSNQPRSATPSPPPATVVSRGVLWPRPPVLDTGASQQQQHPTAGAREVSPDGGSMNKTAKVVVAPDRHQQQWSAPTAASEGGGDGPRNNNNSWASSHADRSRVTGHTGGGDESSSGGDVAAAASASAQGVAPAERSALDHQDAEVVSLLQRMAKEAQDSPSRKRAALAAQQWEGAQQPHHSSASASASSQHLQQPQFQMPRQAAAAPGAAEGSDESGQSQQTVSDAQVALGVTPGPPALVFRFPAHTFNPAIIPAYRSTTCRGCVSCCFVFWDKLAHILFLASDHPALSLLFSPPLPSRPPPSCRCAFECPEGVRRAFVRHP